MFARSITITGDPAALDAGIAYVRDEVMPTVTALDGCIGLSMLVDRESGQCIVTSSWSIRGVAWTPATCTWHRCDGAAERSWAARRRSRSGRSPCMHREHAATEGSCCRVTWMRLPQGEIDRGIEVYRSVAAARDGDASRASAAPACW